MAIFTLSADRFGCAGRCEMLSDFTPRLYRQCVSRWGLLFLLLTGWDSSGAVNAASEIKVAFLAPDPSGTSIHWDRTVKVMQAVAEDMQIDLQVAYSKTNSYTNRKRGLALLTDERKPDYFVTGYWSGATDTLLARAEGLEVHSFLIGSGVAAADRDVLRTPRTKYRHWLAQMTPDERQGGYELAERLIEKAGRRRPGETVHAVALQGFGDTTADIERTAGFKEYLANRSGAELDHTLLAEWSQKTAYRTLEDILSPASRVSVVWSLSDAMALGAVQAVKDAGKQPGQDVFIGGFDWSLEGIKAVSAGDMEVTLGGHFLQGAWALVLLYDYHHGKDFADDLGVQFHTPLEPLTAADAQTYLDILTEADWSSVDFKQFSKVHNPGLKTYQWPLKQILEQLQ